MFPQQPQQQFRKAGADVQIFYGSGGTTVAQCQRSWNKPKGVSHIYMMLIGGGAAGNGVDTGGGSGAVTVWYGAAQNVPDSLVVIASSIGATFASTVSARVSNSGTTPTALLTANSSTGTSGAAVTAVPLFAASGFYQSVAGQDGSTSVPRTASATTFLGGGGYGGPSTGNYGYITNTGAATTGYFMLQPIIVGVGGAVGGQSAVGCGGGYNGTGGPGLVLIASW